MVFPIEFELPSHLIAQEPLARRDDARLMVVRRQDQSLEHRRISDLPDLLAEGDLLVLNDTRVLAARLLGHRKRTGGKWEGLFVKTLPDGSWEMLCRGRLREGEIVIVAAELELHIGSHLGPGRWQVIPQTPGSAEAILEKYGHMPLPPYIRKGNDRAEDRERYQTVYAQRAGAIAAPTAGLHFTPELLQRLTERGIAQSFVTLHVGLGTFQPIQTDDFSQHVMHREWGELPEATAQAIAGCRERKGRVVAVGTTAVRVLETVAASGLVRAWSGETDLFIRPPYEFAVADVLLTNFHLPHTTLLLLAGAFAGVSLLEKAYKVAIAEGYHFFSYGDAMLIV